MGCWKMSNYEITSEHSIFYNEIKINDNEDLLNDLLDYLEGESDRIDDDRNIVEAILKKVEKKRLLNDE